MHNCSADPGAGVVGGHGFAQRWWWLLHVQVRPAAGLGVLPHQQPRPAAESWPCLAAGILDMHRCATPSLPSRTCAPSATSLRGTLTLTFAHLVALFATLSAVSRPQEALEKLKGQLADEEVVLDKPKKKKSKKRAADSDDEDEPAAAAADSDEEQPKKKSKKDKAAKADKGDKGDKGDKKKKKKKVEA